MTVSSYGDFAPVRFQRQGHAGRVPNQNLPRAYNQNESYPCWSRCALVVHSRFRSCWTLHLGTGCPAKASGRPRAVSVCPQSDVCRRDLILLGEALLFGSLILLWYAAAFFAAAHSFVVLYEEPALRRQFGESYEAYGRRVHRWLPHVQLKFAA